MSRVALASLLLTPRLAWADGGGRISPDGVWLAWSFDPLVLFSLLVLSSVYLRGLRRRRQQRMSLSTVLWFASMLMIATALLSPLDALSDELASAHMLQHVLLMSVAAPLFVLARPDIVLPAGIPRGWLQREAAGLAADPWLWNPLVVGLAYAAALWLWHWPPLYVAALRDLIVHDAEHLSFFVAGCLFWRVVLIPKQRAESHGPIGAALLFGTALHASLLGIFLTLSPQPWYGDYAGRTAAWSLDLLEDQQLAGLLMWVPACMIYPAAAALIFGRWLEARLPAATHERLQPRSARP